MAEALDTLDFVVNQARVVVNDAIGNGLAGEVLTDAQPFTIQIINGAWRRLQDQCAKLGFPRLTNTTILGLSASSGDAGTQLVINWASSPALPSDCIVPLALQERVAGAGSDFYKMDPTRDMPLVAQGVWNKMWEWRGDALLMPGTIQAQQIWMSYASLLPDFVPASTTPFASQTVPINRAADPFSLYIAAIFCAARGSVAAPALLKQAEDAVLILVGRENPGALVAATAAKGAA